MSVEAKGFVGVHFLISKPEIPEDVGVAFIDEHLMEILRDIHHKRDLFRSKREENCG